MNPETPKNSRLAAVAVAAMVGITLYWTFTYSGPYRYLAELQLKWMGYYVPKLTAMVIILGFLAIAGVIKVILRGAERPVPGPANGPVAAVPVTNTAVPQPWLQYVRYAAPLIVVGIGGWMYFNGTQAGGLQQLTAVDFGSGKPQSRIVYADVRGHLSRTYLSKENYLYIPMYTEANGKAPVRLVVGVNERDANKRLHAEADGSVIVRGIADKGLEGEIRRAHAALLRRTRGNPASVEIGRLVFQASLSGRRETLAATRPCEPSSVDRNRLLRFSSRNLYGPHRRVLSLLVAVHGEE